MVKTSLTMSQVYPVRQALTWLIMKSTQVPGSIIETAGRDPAESTMIRHGRPEKPARTTFLAGSAKHDLGSQN